MRKYFTALTIAGSDSGGGAGVQADLKTFSALGCYGMSAITAITAQNTKAVKKMRVVSPGLVSAQIDAVLSDIGANAIKTGMLFSAKTIRAVERSIRRGYKGKIVVDPVMVSKSGRRLLKENAVAALKKYLFPLSAVVTPNIPEAEIILGMKINSQKDMEIAARRLCEMGACAAVVKGGHAVCGPGPDCVFFAEQNKILWLKTALVKTQNTHGTGCVFSAAITACLARGLDIERSIIAAKKYISNALKYGAKYKIGRGCGPVNHFYALWTDYFTTDFGAGIKIS